VRPQENASARLRLFIAVELPDEWLAALEEIQTRLRHQLETPGRPRLRWVRPEGIHLTLKFLGNVDSERLPDLQREVANAVPGDLRIMLRPGAPGVLGRGNRVSVLWVGLSGDVTALTALASKIDVACAQLGFAAETKPFASHLTLARAPDDVRIGLEEIQPYLQKTRFEAPAFAVNFVSLMQSHLGPGGARYERIYRWPADFTAFQYGVYI
jgi:2'-5' RNA ligase